MKLFVVVCILLYLFLTIVDTVLYRRIHGSAHSLRKGLFLGQAIVCFLALPSVVAITFLSGDNGPAVMRSMMILLTFWIISAFVKLPTYAFVLLAPKSRRTTVVALVISATMLCLMLLNVFKYRTDIAVRHTIIQCDRLPESFDGYRILLFSDVHLGTMMDADKECISMVDSINATAHDLTVFAGDMVTVRHQEITPSLLRILSRIERHDGIVSVQGNHDVGYYIIDTVATHICASADGVIDSERRMGWTVLRDSTLYISRGADSIAVTGIGYSELREGYKHWSRTAQEYDPRPLLDSIPGSAFSIVVAHQPQFWQNILACNGTDLTLSGHVHACQFSINLPNRRISPASLVYDNWSGLYQQNGKYLYVNDGIGCVGYFLRIGARPEISVIELRCR